MPAAENSKVSFYRDPYLPFFELKQCSTGELSYRKHAHEEYSVGIVEQGQSFFWCRGQTTILAPQTVVFLPPDSIHSCNPFQPDQWAYTMLFVDAKWVQGFISSHKYCFWNRPIIKAAAGHEAVYASNMLLQAFRSEASPLEKEAVIAAFFEQTLAGGIVLDYIDSNEAQPKLKVIRDYVQHCFLEKITLEQLEAISGLNKFHIIRLFKQFYQIPPHTYQTLLRVNYAKKELLKHRPLAEVALDAGFYDQSHFTKVFKAYTGVTPDHYQS